MRTISRTTATYTLTTGGDLDRGLGEGRSRRVSAEIFFAVPQNVTFGEDGGRLTVFVNFNIQPIDFVYI